MVADVILSARSFTFTTLASPLSSGGVGGATEVSGMKRYEVTFVRPDDLPSEHKWALARDKSTGVTYVFVKRCEVCPRVLEEAWAAYRRIARKFRLVA